MNNKGITLIEMIGVFIILVIVLLVAVPRAIAAIRKSRDDQYVNYEKILQANMDLYVQDKKEDLFTAGSYGGSLLLTLEDLKESNKDIDIGPCTVNKLSVTRISTCVSGCDTSDKLYHHKYKHVACITCTDDSRTYTSDYDECQ